MRSRNGNRPFLYAICAITTASSLLADNYLIGYRLTTRNAQSIHESLNISKAMMPCPTQKGLSLMIDRDNNESLETLLFRERTLFLEYTAAQTLRLKSNERLLGTDINSMQTLTLPTMCYAVEFNDRSVTITLLHQ